MSTTTTEHQYWEDRAETFDEDSSYIVGDELSNAIQGWLRDQFAPTDEVLELGCGTGTFSAAVAPVVKGLIATDMSEPMLHQAKVKLGAQGNVGFQQQDAYATTFDASTFDAVLMVNLLHIVHEPGRVLQEAGRVVKDGGRIVVADVTSQGTPLLAGMRLGMRYLRRWGRPPASSRNISLRELVRLTQDAGFLVKEEALIGTKLKAACVTAYKLAQPMSGSEL